MKDKIIKNIDIALKGASNEDAEKAALYILSQLIAKRVYVDNDARYVKQLLSRIFESADRYAQEHSIELAAAKVMKKRDFGNP